MLHAVLRLKSPDELVAAFDSASKVPTINPDEEEGMAVDGDEAEGEEKRKRKKGETVLGMRELLDGLIPYSERHFTRIDKLVQDSYMLDYVVGEMDGGLFGGEVMDIDGE